MRVKITSNGTARGTRIVNADTEEPLERVTEATWSVKAGDTLATATLVIANVEVDLVGFEPDEESHSEGGDNGRIS